MILFISYSEWLFTYAHASALCSKQRKDKANLAEILKFCPLNIPLESMMACHPYIYKQEKVEITLQLRLFHLKVQIAFQPVFGTGGFLYICSRLAKQKKETKDANTNCQTCLKAETVIMLGEKTPAVLHTGKN